jgi:uncharacterized membrane protein YkvA (DUF1232 family)
MPIEFSSIRTALLICLVSMGLYALFVLFLYVAGKKMHARAIGGFIPDCIILVKRLLGDERVHKKYKLLLLLLVGYLGLPFDIIPDFIPVAGQLDDLIIVALVLRFVVQHAGKEVVTQQWPGPQKSLKVILKFAG